MKTIAQKFQIYGLHLEGEPDRIRYVGQTRQGIKLRLRQHGYCYNMKLPISCWITRHGKSNVHARLLEAVDLKDELDEAEVRWIAHFRKLGLADLNVSSGGQNSYERKSNREYTERMRRVHAGKHGAEGEKNPASKLTRTDVENLWQSHVAGIPPSVEDALRLGVSLKTLKMITSGHAWRSVTGLSKPVSVKRPKVQHRDADLIEAYDLYSQGYSLDEAASGFSFSPSYLCTTIKGKTATHLQLKDISRGSAEGKRMRKLLEQKGILLP